MVALLVGCCLTAACGGGGGESSQPPPDPLYVTASGSDTNVGDARAPLRSIAKAVQLAWDDYAVIVGPGTYPETVTTDRTGTPARRLTIIADVTGQRTGAVPGPVIIDSQGKPRNAALELSSTAGTTVDGFMVTGGADGGIVLKSGSDGVQIRNCIVFGNPGNRGDGIRVQDSKDVLLFNNLVYGNDGTGVEIVGTINGSPNARLISNTIADNAFRGITVGTTNKASPGAMLRNNILYNNGRNPQPLLNIKVLTRPRSDLDFSGDFNLVFPRESYDPDTAGVVGAHDVNVDPQFADSEAGDYHLVLTSPAIDAGSTPDVNSDLLQMLRLRTTSGGETDTGPFDIGFHYLP